MRKIRPIVSHGLGSEKTNEATFSPVQGQKNHFSSLSAYPKEVREQITSWGLTRVAGNVFICPSSANFWAVKGGKIVKLTGDEVDNGEHIAGVPTINQNSFLPTYLMI